MDSLDDIFEKPVGKELVKEALLAQAVPGWG
jgi:hypothetical protein